MYIYDAYVFITVVCFMMRTLSRVSTVCNKALLYVVGRPFGPWFIKFRERAVKALLLILGLIAPRTRRKLRVFINAFQEPLVCSLATVGRCSLCATLIVRQCDALCPRKIATRAACVDGYVHAPQLVQYSRYQG